MSPKISKELAKQRVEQAKENLEEAEIDVYKRQVLGMSALFEVQANKDIEEYNKIGFAYELSEEEKNIAKELNIEVNEGNEDELKTKYENDEIDLYITKDGNKYILNGNDSDAVSYTHLSGKEFNSKETSKAT